MVLFEFKAVRESSTMYESAPLLYQWCSSDSKYCDTNGLL